VKACELIGTKKIIARMNAIEKRQMRSARVVLLWQRSCALTLAIRNVYWRNAPQFMLHLPAIKAAFVYKIPKAPKRRSSSA